MQEVLNIISQLLESPARVLTADDIDELDTGVRDFLLSRRLLVPARPASSVTCNTCHEDHVEEVTRVRDRTGATSYRHYCPESGWVEICGDRLKQWAVDANNVAVALADSLCPGSSPAVVTEGASWWLGEFLAADVSYNLVLSLQGGIQSIGSTMPAARVVAVFPRVPADQEHGFAAALALQDAFSLDGQLQVNSTRIRCALRTDDAGTLGGETGNDGFDEAGQVSEEAEVDIPLSDRAQEILAAMYEMQAFNSDHRKTNSEITARAVSTTADPNAQKEVFSELKGAELLAVKRGRAGGYWLTRSGKARARRLAEG